MKIFPNTSRCPSRSVLFERLSAMSPGPACALSALAVGGGSEAVVRGELNEQRRFVALRKMRWGTQILTERPLLHLEAIIEMGVQI